MASGTSEYMLDGNIMHYDQVCNLIHYIFLNSLTAAVQLVTVQ